jgi:hypothetical protein
MCQLLKCFVYPVQKFSAQVELAGPELVNLTPWIREDILLAFQFIRIALGPEDGVCRAAAEIPER